MKRTLKRPDEPVNKLVQFINNALVFTGGIFLVGMIVLTCANILLREISTPLRGTFELMGLFGAAVGALALGYTQMKKGHIAVDVLINAFSPKTRGVLSVVNNLLCMLFFALAAWQLALKGMVLFNSGEVTETLRIIYYPFTFAVALGCGALVLVFLSDLAGRLFPGKRGKTP